MGGSVWTLWLFVTAVAVRALASPSSPDNEATPKFVIFGARPVVSNPDLIQPLVSHPINLPVITPRRPPLTIPFALNNPLDNPPLGDLPLDNNPPAPWARTPIPIASLSDAEPDDIVGGSDEVVAEVVESDGEGSYYDSLEVDPLLREDMNDLVQYYGKSDDEDDDVFSKSKERMLLEMMALFMLAVVVATFTGIFSVANFLINSVFKPTASTDYQTLPTSQTTPTQAQPPNTPTTTSTARAPRLQPSILWGVFGVGYLLFRAVPSLFSYAMLPFSHAVFGPGMWCAYIASVLGVAYVEGYKAFHLKFSPMVVARCATLPERGNWFRVLLAPLYGMGLICSTTKRKVIAVCGSTAIAGLVFVVKRLPGPWRAVVDAGACVGLTIGCASLVYHLAKYVITGELPKVDTAFPPDSSQTSRDVKLSPV